MAHILLSSRKVILVACVVFVFCALLIIVRWIVVMPSFLPYHGDGEFVDRSRRIMGFPISKYSIYMEQFDLSKPFTARYKLTGIPNDRLTGVYLLVPDPTGRIKNLTGKLGGSLAITVFDSKEELVTIASGALSEFTRSESANDFVLYQSRLSNFVPVDQENYCVSILYEPDRRLIGIQGRVIVQSLSGPGY